MSNFMIAAVIRWFIEIEIYMEWKYIVLLLQVYEMAGR